MASTLGIYNPLRYRGYVYDVDTGLYYLQSRYYNPEMGRFINADSYASTGQGILSNNMFAYCNNNPVNMTDTTGNYPWWAILGIAIVSVIGGIWGATYDQRLGVDNDADNTSATIPSIPNAATDDNMFAPGSPPAMCPDATEPNIANDNRPLTTGDRVRNTVIGASLGLAVGGGAVATAGAGLVIAGVAGGSQVFAIGALAYNFFAIIVAPFFGVEMDPIEVEP